MQQYRIRTTAVDQPETSAGSGPSTAQLRRARIAGAPTGFSLESGGHLSAVDIAYETSGALNESRTNAILVCHALSGDQFVGSRNPVTGRPAWWSRIVGSGKPVDTSRFFVISSNVLGGCMGSTGPSSATGDDGQALEAGFPGVTIGDMVRAQRGLLDVLGIESLLGVIGGSMGGMQVLEWAARFPEQVYSAIPIACAARQSAQNIGFYEVGRQAIMADPDWREGRYGSCGVRPERGLGVARMAAHITYMSERGLKQRFDRSFQCADAQGGGFGADFQIESYLRHQGRSFVDRFDANSYIILTRAMDQFDLASARGDGRLSAVFRDTATYFCVFSFSSDWHYPPSESRDIVRALHAAGAEVSYLEIGTDDGHDGFLLPSPRFEQGLAGFLDAVARRRGVSGRRGSGAE